MILAYRIPFLLYTQFKPQFLVAVPRLFETIYRGVQQKFASETKAKARIIKFFRRVSMAFVKAKRIATGLVLRERPPNPIEKVIYMTGQTIDQPSALSPTSFQCSSLPC